MGLHQHLDDLGVHRRSSGRDRLDRGRQLARIVHALLEQIRAATGAGLEQGEHVVRIGELAQHDHADLRMLRSKLAGDLDSLVGAGRRHPDVGEHDVGFLLLDRSYQRVAIGAAARDLDALGAREDLLQCLTHQIRVVGNHDPDACALSA